MLNLTKQFCGVHFLNKPAVYKPQSKFPTNKMLKRNGAAGSKIHFFPTHHKQKHNPSPSEPQTRYLGSLFTVMVYYNPHTTVQYNSLDTLNNQVFFHCSRVCGDLFFTFQGAKDQMVQQQSWRVVFSAILDNGFPVRFPYEAIESGVEGCCNIDKVHSDTWF